MRKLKIFGLIVLTLSMLSAMNAHESSNAYFNFYQSQIDDFEEAQQQLISYVQSADLSSVDAIKEQIWQARLK